MMACWFIEKHPRQLSWTVIWTFREIKLFKRELSISTFKSFYYLLAPILDNFQLLSQFLLFLNPVQTDALLVANNSQHFLGAASVCTPCCMLLTFAGSGCAKLETRQTFSHVQTNATTLQTLLGVVASVCV